MLTKVCTSCGIEKPATAEFFYKSKQGKYGLYSRCKGCHQTTCKKWAGKNPESRQKTYKKYHEKVKQVNLQSSIPEGATKHCLRCELTFPATPEFFHKDIYGKYGLGDKCKKCSNEIKMNNYYLDGSREREASRQWKENNKEKMAEYNAKYYDEHKEVIAETHREWLENNKEYMEAYYESNKEWIRARVSLWRDKNRESHRENKRMQQHRRRSRSVGSDFDYSDYDTIVVRDEGKCGICGFLVAPCDIHIDHIIPLSKGGTHTLENLQITHAECNLSKGDKILPIKNHLSESVVDRNGDMLVES